MLVLSGLDALYDGSSGDARSVHRKADLHLDKGRIVALRPHDPALTDGNGRQRVDCSGLVATPGLVDAHGHVTILGLTAPEMERMNGAEALLRVERILHATLVNGGVTTMRDVGGATHLMKRLVDEGQLIGPRLKIAICMLSSTGGHADFRGPDRCHAELSRLWPEGPGRPSSIVDGPWECRKRVREVAACGADLIKLCTSPGVASPGDALEHRDFTAEEIAAICDEAGARGLRVAAHAHSRSGIRLAIENGVSDLQHISFLDDELAELAHKRGCTVTPTSWIMEELQNARGLSDFVMTKVRQVAEGHRAAVAAAARAGLTLLAGTDPVLPGMHGRNFLEIAALVRDGLTPLAAWHAMTGAAAEVVGQSDAGTLRPGQRADVLLWRGNVLADPALMDRGALVEVLQDGVGHRAGLPGLPQRDFRGIAEALVAGGAARA